VFDIKELLGFSGERYALLKSGIPRFLLILSVSSSLRPKSKKA
jgi:hypothetical protein